MTPPASRGGSPFPVRATTYLACALAALALGACSAGAAEPGEEAEALESDWTVRPSGPTGETSILLTAPEGVDLAEFHLGPRIDVKHYNVDATGHYELVGHLGSDMVQRLNFPLGQVPVKRGQQTTGRLGALRVKGGGVGRMTSLLHRVGSWESPEMYDRSNGGLVLEPTPFSVKIERDGVAVGCFGEESPYYRDGVLKQYCPKLLDGKSFPAKGRYDVELTTRDRMGARVATKQSLFVGVAKTVDIRVPGAVAGALTFDAPPPEAIQGAYEDAVLVSCTVPGPYSPDFLRTAHGVAAWSTLQVWALEGVTYACEYRASGSIAPFQIVGGARAALPLRRIEVADPIVGASARRGTFVVSQWRAGSWVGIGHHTGASTPIKTGVALHVVPGKYRVQVSYVDDFGLPTSLPAEEKDLSN